MKLNMENNMQKWNNNQLAVGNRLLLQLSFVFLLASCTKNFENINEDDTRVTAERYQAEYSLTRAQLEFTGNSDYSYETWRVNIIYCGMMMQQLANTGWYAGDKYERNDGWSASYFEVAYRDQVRYLVDMLRLVENKPAHHNLYQVGRIMRVLIFHRLTDLYGDIPYQEAGLGYLEGIFTPRYDRQPSVYFDMLHELDDAAEKLDPAANMPGKADLIYGLSSDSYGKWKKFAYSLMLRLGMRLVKRDPEQARFWVEKAFAGGVMQSNDDNALVQHEEAGGRATVNRNSNILGGEWNATGWNRAPNAKSEVFLSKTLIEMLRENDDPRLGLLAQIRADGNQNPAVQTGMPNGYNQSNNAFDISLAPGFPGSVEKYSTIRGDIWLRLNGPTLILSYAQCQFLLAEAALRGWSVGQSADMYYYSGVRAAMQQIQQYNPSAMVAESSISEYLSQHPFNFADGLEMIGQQYWLCCFLDWYEAWANWRRIGFPVLIPVNYPGNATQGRIPRRMLYPTSEASINPSHYQAAIQAQGPNDFMTRVWWDD